MSVNKLYTKDELKQLEKTGELALADSDLLATKFADRFEMAAKLFEKLDTVKFLELNEIDPTDEPNIEDWKDENIPDKSYAVKHQGPVFGFDIDTMVGPKDWYDEDANTGDRVTRRKCYIYNWTQEKLQQSFPELEYFTELHAAFVPVLEHYMKECFTDQLERVKFNLYKLMVIEYSHPTATEETIVEHRKHNTERFGDIHCDETLCGLHLGENYVEFYIENHLTGERKHVEGLDQNKALQFFGEFSQQSGWQPGYHGMMHNPNTNLGTRYSIIFDLQARYIGED